MNATDELHHMLDELRNLASDVNEAEIRSHSVINLIQGPYNRRFVLDMNHDWLNAWHAEFESILHAIAAMLGRGECQIETTENWLPAERYHRCKECGAFFAVLDASHDILPRYCPNCGRRVVSE